MKEMSEEFIKTITIYPAWDKRDPDPHKNCGIGGAVLGFYLKGVNGVIQFTAGTGWYLPQNRSVPSKPMAYDLGYHSYIPRYQNQTMMTEKCEQLDGKPCYYDGSTLNAEPVFELLIAEGSGAVWRALENEYYLRLFGEGR